MLDDPYKPHFNALFTPAGHNLTLVSPAEHRHHKGLMYALKCEDVNFWEEDPSSGKCGIQEIVSTTDIDGYWKPPRAALTITQDQEYGWFALREGLPYLSVGQSILGDVAVSEGAAVTETYTILIGDR